jgi:tRNA G37 N-methylase Trm5
LKFIKDFYYCFRAKALNAFPIIRYLKKYNIILPKIYYHIFWLINKPKKINFENRIFYLSLEEQPEPSRQFYSYKKIYNDYERYIINTEVKKGDICLDIGANIGFFTHLFLKKIGHVGKVFSFEANQKIFDILKKNFKYEKNVIFYKGFVGDEISIDSIIKKKIHFIKIDIDGRDLIALKSCNNLIDSFKPKIIIELSEDSYRAHGIHYFEVIEFLNKKKYHCYEVLKNPKLFDRDLKKNEVINIFAK